MTTEVTIQQIYWNRGLRDFFFRDQAMNTLINLLDRAKIGARLALDAIDEQSEEMSLDDVEELFYSYGTEDCAEAFCIELEDEDTEED